MSRGSLMPVLRKVSGNGWTGDESSFARAMDLVNLVRCRKKPNVDPVGVWGCQGSLKFVAVVGDGGRVCFRRRSFDLLAQLWFNDRPADEQQSVQDFVPLCEPDDILSDVRCFQVDRNQDVVLPILGNEGQHFVDGRDFLASEVRVEPASGIELSDPDQRQVFDLPRSVGGSINSVVVDADQVAVFRPGNIEFESESQFQTRSEVRQRVLGRVPQQATMGDNQWARLSGVEARCGETESENCQAH